MLHEFLDYYSELAVLFEMKTYALRKPIASGLRKINLVSSVVYTYQHTTTPERAVLFLHGFPAEAGKNEDIALKIAESLGCDTYVPHYPGLGENQGEFSFQGCILSSIELAQTLLKRFHYTKLDLVGHSWGGFVAYHLASILKETQSLVLLAPFSKNPSEKEVILQLKKFKFFQSLKHRPCNREALAQDFAFTLKNYDFPPLPKNCKTWIIQGSKDSIVTPQSTQALSCRIPNSLYSEVEDNHGFQNREVTYHEILKALSE